MPTLKREIEHPCGKRLTQVDRTEMYDITSYDDVPPMWRDSRGVPTISFSSLPLAYHKFIPIKKRPYWMDGEQIVEECPHCYQKLEPIESAKSQ